MIVFACVIPWSLSFLKKQNKYWPDFIIGTLVDLYFSLDPIGSRKHTWILFLEIEKLGLFCKMHPNLNHKSIYGRSLFSCGNYLRSENQIGLFLGTYFYRIIFFETSQLITKFEQAFDDRFFVNKKKNMYAIFMSNK